jgi:hypothetical protein
VRYRIVIRDPMGMTIRIDTGEVSEAGSYTYDFRNKNYPSLIGGLIIGTVFIEWDTSDGGS